MKADDTDRYADGWEDGYLHALNDVVTDTDTHPKNDFRIVVQAVALRRRRWIERMQTERGR